MRLISVFALAPPFTFTLGDATPTSGRTVARAIQNAFALLSNLHTQLSTPKLWHVEADYDVDLPWAAYFTSAAERDITTGDPYVAHHVIQFTFADHTAEGAQDLALAFSAKWPNGFDRAPLVVNGDPVAVAQFTDDGQTTIGEGKGPNGHDCYLHIMMYEVMLATSRA